jgi:hypothetical protein
MTIKTFVKTQISLLALCLAAASHSAFAAETVSAKLRQNLEIMQDILQKSLEQGPNADIGRIQHSYLAGQGVLFQTSSNGGFGHFFPVAPMAPMAPIAGASAEEMAAVARNINVDVQVNTQFDEEAFADLADQAEEMADAFSEQQEQMRDQLRDLREQKRDLERELRDVEREKRDIEFSQKVGKLDAEQQKTLKALSERQASLKKQVDDMQKKYAAQELEVQKKRAEQQKIAEQRQQALVTRVGTNFAATLCDYGASLRELKDNEFVSLQLSSHGRDNRDTYWVFKKSDINQCVSGKINASALLKKANAYQY